MKTARGTLLLAMDAGLIGCAPSPQDVAGRYSHENRPSNLTVDIRKDGSFVEYKNELLINAGHWHFTKHLLFDTGIELDGDGSARVNRSADEYRLVFRHGAYCWEVERDFDYWCRNKEP